MTSFKASLLLSCLVVGGLLFLSSFAAFASDTDGGGGADGVAVVHQRRRARTIGAGTAAAFELPARAAGASAAPAGEGPAGEGRRPRGADGEPPSIAGAADDRHRAYDPAVAPSDEEKLGNRELNREHAKNTRLRKKAYVERRKISVEPGGSGADAGNAPRGGIEGVDILAKSGPTTDLHKLDGDIIPMKTDENGLGIELKRI